MVRKMKMYNDTVMEHFMNPHNVGEIENADGEGIYGKRSRTRTVRASTAARSAAI